MKCPWSGCWKRFRCGLRNHPDGCVGIETIMDVTGSRLTGIAEGLVNSTVFLNLQMT